MAHPNFPGAMGLGTKTGQSVQIQLVGMVDSKVMHERLLHTCRGICGKVEHKLLHRETVYKQMAPAPGLPPPRASYELRVRLGKTASTDSEKFVQPVSMSCLGDFASFPAQAEKYLKLDDQRRRLQKPTLRKMVEVDVGPAYDEVLRMLGFEQDFVFIRSGQMFQTGVDGRTTILISELHKLHVQQQTPKLEMDAKGNPVDDVWLIEVITCSESEGSPGLDSAIKEHLLLADKLQPYVTLNSPEEAKKAGWA
mmetsp:Transcript_8010/g.19910  ORF Transcript_8010/g.19910 Transcript_8010/m.19910 type:complete len:252 (+) Transcript_8010:273-1028(+)